VCVSACGCSLGLPSALPSDQGLHRSMSMRNFRATGSSCVDSAGCETRSEATLIGASSDQVMAGAATPLGGTSDDDRRARGP
jgi:hypothetical protein